MENSKLKKAGIFSVLLLIFLSFDPSCVLALSEVRNQASAYKYYMQGLYCDRLGNMQEAIENYRKASGIDKESTSILFRLAIDYIKTGELDKAIKELEKIGKIDPDDIDSKILLSVVYSSQGKDEEAVLIYQHALEAASKVNPENINIYHSLARLYFQQREFDRAIEVYRDIIKLDSKDSVAHFFLGMLYEEKGKRKDAIGSLQIAIELAADFSDALNSLAYIYAEEGINLKKAEGMAKDALKTQPENPAYIDSLGWIYYKQGRIEESIVELEKAVSLLDDPVIYEHLGDAYFKKELLDDAKKQWEKSISLDPEQVRVKNKIQSLGKDELPKK